METKDEIIALAARYGFEAQTKRTFDFLESMDTQIKTLVVAGGNNAGKSRVLNILAGRELQLCGPTTTPRPQIQVSYTRENEIAQVGGQTLALEDYIRNIRQYSDNELPLHFTVHSEWLEKTAFSIEEVPAEAIVKREDKFPPKLREASAVLYIMSALSPFNKTDMEAIALCAVHSIPLRLYVSGVDLIEEEGERAEILQYIGNQLRHLSEDLSCQSVRLDSKADAEWLRGDLLAWLNGLDFGQVRQQRMEILNLEALQALASWADIMRKDSQSRFDTVRREQKQKHEELEGLGLVWVELEHDMEDRRIALTKDEGSRLTARITAARQTLSQDVPQQGLQKWVETVLPQRLQSEFEQMQAEMERNLNRQFEIDRGWLIDQVKEHFGLTVCLMGGDVALANPGGSDQPLQINSPSKYVLIAGAGVAMIAVAPITMPILAAAAGIVTTVTGVGLTYQALKANRTSVQTQISHELSTGAEQYQREISERLKAAYAELELQLRRCSTEWVAGQSRAIDSLRNEDEHAPAYWDGLLAEVEKLKAKVFA